MKNLVKLIVFFGILVLTVFSGCDTDSKSWQKAQKKNTIKAYKEFLKNYPESEYSTDAKAEIAWKGIYTKNITGAYEQFLKDYPESKYVQKAKQRIDSLLFEGAKRINTIFSYKHFLKKIPETRYEDEIHTLVRKLKQDWQPAMRDVKTVYLKIIESFPEGYEFPKDYVKKELKNIFDDVFVQLINDEERADAVLKIDIQGKALGEQYGLGDFPDTRYSGAIISGTVDFIKGGKEKFTLTFYNKKPPPTRISMGDYSGPSDAPFTDTFKGTDFFRKVYLQIFKECRFSPGLIWRICTGENVITDPAVENGRVYVGSSDNYIYAFDAKDGTLEWKYRTGDAVNFAPAVAHGLVYAGSDDHYLYALDARSGLLKWKFKTGGKLIASPTASHKKVYFISDDEYIYALDAQKGGLKWKDKIGADKNSSPVVVNGTVYVPSSNCYMNAFNSNDGSIQWKIQKWGKLTSPAVADSTVFMGAKDGYVYAVGGKYGKLDWEDQIGFIDYKPTVFKGTLYIGSGVFYALNTKDGTVKWEFDIRKGSYTRPVISDETLYLGSTDNYLYALDSQSGLLKWAFKTRGLVTSPAIWNGVLYVTSKENYIYAFTIDY